MATNEQNTTGDILAMGTGMEGLVAGASMVGLAAAIDRRIEVTRQALADERARVTRIAELEGDIKRLEAARKALTAKQSPSGRERIGAAARRPRKKPSDAQPLEQLGLHAADMRSQ